MASKDHALLKVGGAAAAAWAAYEFVYKPWHNAQLAAQLAATPGVTGASPFVTTSAGGNFGFPYLTMPQSIGPTPSNLDPGAAVGGPVGYCMHKKGWTQTQCTARYNAIVSAYQQGSAALASLQSGQAAAATQAQIDATNAALAKVLPQYNAAIAAGDAGTANQLKIQIDGWNADLANLRAQLAAIATRIAGYQHDLAGLAQDFQTLFGMSLGSPQLIAA